MNLVEVNDLFVQLGERKVLKGVNLQLAKGEILSLVGANGVGKSTLLKVLTQMVPIQKGEVFVLQTPVHKSLSRKKIRELRSQVGQVFQSLQLVARLSVLENVLIGRLGHNSSILTWARVYSKKDHQRAEKAIEVVGLQDFKIVRVDRLSGGQRQKVAMARALAQQAPLILADEPTSNLDPVAAEEMAELLVRLSQQYGIGVITAVHTLSMLNNLGGRVLGLKSGQVAFDVPVDEVSESQLQELYKGNEL